MTIDDGLPPRLPLPLPRVVERLVRERFVTALLDRDGRAWRLADARASDGRLVRTRLGITHRVFTAADGERRVAALEPGEPRDWDERYLQPQLERARVVRPARPA